MVIKDLIGPQCWVCERRFNNQFPPGPANEERHHLFPRAFGGTDGPVVSLCDFDHTRVHKIAYAVKAKRDHKTFLLGTTVEQQKKLLWIASLIVKAEALTKGDKNKPIKVVLVLDHKRQRQALDLKQVLNAKSITEVFNHAFDRLVARVLQTKELK